MTATDVDALHASEAVVVTDAVHDPGRSDEAEADRQEQAMQPVVRTADPEQQQPPRHKSLAQSSDTAHGSPGGYVRHKPVCSAQPEQLSAIAVELQHAPLRHEPEMQEEVSEHTSPDERQGEKLMERIRWPGISEVYTAAVEDTATKRGRLNIAFVPKPSR